MTIAIIGGEGFLGKRLKNNLDEKGIEYSKDYWFKSFRTPPYHKNLDNLKRYKKILDSRLDLALKIN